MDRLSSFWSGKVGFFPSKNEKREHHVTISASNGVEDNTMSITFEYMYENIDAGLRSYISHQQS